MKREIVSMEIIGGLGNQMFQYAAGLSLARKVGADLHLDVSGFGTYALRTCALSTFGIDTTQPPIARTRVEKIKDTLNARVRRRVFPQTLGGLRIEVEPHHHFWEEFYALHGSCHLRGYWQSPLYFRGVEGELRKIFDLSRFSDKTTRSWEERINTSQPSVAVHIRRGDYIRDPVTLQTHGLCERSYYDRARAILTGLLGTPACPPKFFVFSDDVVLAQAELSHWDGAEFISGMTQEQDMMLMAQCQHAIIANSSFSWWAAWLNANLDKQVIAPRQWFAPQAQRKLNVTDLLPESWIQA